MAHRYLAFLAGDPASAPRRRGALRARAAALPGFATVLDSDAILLVSDGAPLAVRDAGQSAGAIIGMLYRRGATEAVAALAPAETRAIVATGGAALVERYWGPWVAVLPRPGGGSYVLRAPFGDLACYHITCPEGVILASDVDLITHFARRSPAPDWPQIALHLIAPEIRRRRTCLAAIEELAGGDRLSSGKRLAVETLWSPWTAAARRDRRETRASAAMRIADAVCNAVAARSAHLDATVLLLSGGLDSSIVAAALARAGRRTTALTMVTRDASGDERGHARATAAHLSMPLLEILRETGNVDIGTSAASGLPYPAERSFSQATMQAARAAAESTGANAILHGGGGDNIFCTLQSSAPVADQILSGRLGTATWALTRNIAALAQVTMFAVMRQAMGRLLLRGPGYRWPANARLLTPDGAAHARGALDHPWLDPPDGALPGSAAHVALVLSALSLVQSPDARLPVPSIAVLLAQPVIEACLATPSWLWFERGNNRALARRGFSDLLPPAVAWRRSKGALDSFIIELFEANRKRLRPMLLDGLLAGSGLVDRAAIAVVLSDPAPVRGQDYARLMQFADVEAWLRSWG